MGIYVTPIPKLTEFATPAITFGTAAADGAATSTIRSDSGVIAFNTSVPDAITYGQSGGAGSVNFASRIDHLHAMAANPLADIRCSAYNDSAQVISNTTETPIALNQTTFDTDSMHDDSTNNTRVIFTTAGTYVVTTHASFASNATGYRKITLRLNGSTIVNQIRVAGFSATDNFTTMCTIWTFDADDYVEMVVYQNSGGNLNAETYAPYGSTVTAVKVLG